MRSRSRILRGIAVSGRSVLPSSHMPPTLALLNFLAKPLCFTCSILFPNMCCARCWPTCIVAVMAFPREVYVIYHNLVHENVFADQEWLRSVRRTHQFAIFEAAVRDRSEEH